ncbi:MAG TPA: NifU family protein [Sphingomonadales bacterium]|nr:NifU family protein [Sphingomonadales bacterium]
MFIETEATPNPNTLKFIPDRPVLEKGTFHFTSAEAAKGSPLAEALFAFPEVSGVLLSPSFVSVSLKAGSWEAMKGEILSALLDHFTSGRPAVVPGMKEKPAAAAAGEPKLVAEIRTILDEKVRPAVARDGGDITFEKFEDGIVYLHLKGACSGCPSSILTLKQGIENLLKYYIPEVTEVRAI